MTPSLLHKPLSDGQSTSVLLRCTILTHKEIMMLCELSLGMEYGHILQLIWLTQGWCTTLTGLCQDVWVHRGPQEAPGCSACIPNQIRL